MNINALRRSRPEVPCRARSKALHGTLPVRQRKAWRIPQRLVHDAIPLRELDQLLQLLRAGAGDERLQQHVAGAGGDPVSAGSGVKACPYEGPPGFDGAGDRFRAEGPIGSQRDLGGSGVLPIPNFERHLQRPQLISIHAVLLTGGPWQGRCPFATPRDPCTTVATRKPGFRRDDRYMKCRVLATWG